MAIGTRADRMASRYVSRLGIHAIYVGAPHRRPVKIALTDDLLDLGRDSFTIWHRWWCRSAGEAEAVHAEARRRMAVSSGRARHWFDVSADEARAVIERAAGDLGMPLTADRVIRERVQIFVTEVDSMIAAAATSKILKAANRSFRDARMKASEAGGKNLDYNVWVETYLGEIIDGILAGVSRR